MNQNNFQDSHSDREMTLAVPLSHPCFADHFPGDPLVPGALLLAWLEDRFEKKFERSIQSYKQIKFLSPVRPGDQLQIIVQGSMDDKYLTVTISKDETPVLKGQFCSNSGSRHA